MKTMEELKNMTREERKSYFNEHKSELLDSELTEVSGGEEVINPNSDLDDSIGNFYSSDGYTCHGEVQCKWIN